MLARLRFHSTINVTEKVAPNLLEKIQKIVVSILTVGKLISFRSLESSSCNLYSATSRKVRKYLPEFYLANKRISEGLIGI